MFTIEFIILVLLLYFLFCLSGYGVISLFKLETKNVFIASFLGIFILGLWASFLQIFIPLSGLFSVLAFLPAFLGLKKSYSVYLEWKTLSGYLKFLSLLLFAVPFVFICLIVMNKGVGWAYDTDLYHYQMILWYKEFALAPGLGNLHHRLANSSTWYILMALLPERYIPYLPMVSTATFYPLFFGWLFTTLKNCKQKFQQVYLLVISIFSIWFYGNHLNAELYADPIALILVSVAMYYFLSLVYDKKNKACESLILGLFIITLSFSIKSLSALSVIFACILAFITLYKKNISFKNICIAFSLPALMAMIWLARNIIVSGYPIYPLSIFAFDVDWKMLASTVDTNSLAVQGWARWPQSGYLEALEKGITYWFPSWFDRYINSSSFINFVLIPLALSIIAIAGLIWKKIDKMKAFFLIWAVANIIFWFNMHPDPRFGRDYFWILFALSLSFYSLVFSRNVLFELLLNKNNIVITFCFIVFIVCIYKEFEDYSFSWRLNPWPRQHTIAIEPLPTNSGEYTYSIAEPGNDRCGYTPVPCSFYINPNLQLRNLDDLGDGFYISEIFEEENTFRFRGTPTEDEILRANVNRVPQSEVDNFYSSENLSGNINFESGWSGHEGWGRWSSETNASFVIRVSPEAKGIKLSVTYMYIPHAKTLDLIISVNGIDVVTQAFSTPVTEIDIPLSNEVLATLDSNYNLLRLEFKMPKVLSPKELGEGEETRRLGLGFSGLTVY